MDESLAWLSQALADWEAAEREYKATDKSGSQVWCHTAAKYQQAVEKAVKAIVAALREAGIWRGPRIGFAHEVERYMRWLIRLPRTGATPSVQRRLVRQEALRGMAGMNSRNGRIVTIAKAVQDNGTQADVRS